MSYGVAVRGPVADTADSPIRETARVLAEAGLAGARLGVEKRASFLPLHFAEGLRDRMPDATWHDCSGLVDDCRLVQSPLELEYTRRAARVSDAMMLAGIAAAGQGVSESDVMAAIYDVMFRRGGTYPGFVPLVRSTRTIEHEHGTWTEGRLRRGDLLFLEMAGCVHRYHAPLGRLVFIGKAPTRAARMLEVCKEAEHRAAGAIGPGARADDVYRAWKSALEQAGLEGYERHHCGYATGIGFPPSWSGSGTPRGLRRGSDLELAEGMVFHLMSWLLRTGRGDSFLSDTIVVTDKGCEFLTNVPRQLTVRN
jgi:Xaa-Pro dipeptidase